MRLPPSTGIEVFFFQTVERRNNHMLIVNFHRTIELASNGRTKLVSSDVFWTYTTVCVCVCVYPHAFSKTIYPDRLIGNLYDFVLFPTTLSRWRIILKNRRFFFLFFADKKIITFLFLFVSGVDFGSNAYWDQLFWL